MATQKKTSFSLDVGETVGELANEVKSTVDIAFEQIGLKARSHQPWGGEISVSQQLQTAEKKVNQLEKQLFNTVQRETKEVFNGKKEAEAQRIRELVVALSQEVSSLKYQAAAFTGEVKNITVETITEGPQTYHANFFEWILSMLRDIKKDILKSRTWLSTFNSKKSKKGYWAMF
ncbi:MAG: DUF5660 family protein, partial [Patescibacteria group bacterium]